MWICLPPHSSFLWSSSSKQAQPQAQWSEDKDKCQATCVHHSCTPGSSWVCRTPWQGVQRAGQRQGLGLDTELPDYLGALSIPPNWKLSGGQGLCLPYQVKVSLSTEVFFSPSHRCEKPLVTPSNQSVTLLLGGWPDQSGLCTAPPCHGLSD